MSYSWNAGFSPAAFGQSQHLPQPAYQPQHQHAYPYPPQQQQQQHRGFFSHSPTTPESAGSANAFKSGGKNTSIHPILAQETTLLRYDITKPPSVEIMAPVYYTHGRSQATWNGAKHIRLISKHFPWSIDIKLPTAVSCEIIWDALYNALQQPIADSEWGLIAGDKKQREGIEKAARIRTEKDGKKDLLRVDWLGETVMFRGLMKDDDFEKARLMPGCDPCTETWVVKLCN